MMHRTRNLREDQGLVKDRNNLMAPESAFGMAHRLY